MVNPIFGLDRKTNKQWSARQYGNDQKNIRDSSSSSLSTTVPRTNYTPKKWCRITMINPLSTKQVESKVKTSQMLYCRTLSSILNLLSRNSSLSIQTDSGTDVLGFTTKSPLQRLKPSRHRISWLSITTQMSEVKLHYQFLKSPHYATSES